MDYSCIVGYAKSIYDIPVSYFVSMNIKAVVADLDQTLASAFEPIPQEHTMMLKEELAKNSIRLLVISNNHEIRVSGYCKALGVPYLSSARKYRKGRVLRFLRNQQVEVEDCLFVGDQLFTDGVYVSKLKGRLILVDPLTQKDNWITSISRKHQENKKRKLLKDGKLGKMITKGKESDNVL